MLYSFIFLYLYLLRAKITCYSYENEYDSKCAVEESLLPLTSGYDSFFLLSPYWNSAEAMQRMEKSIIGEGCHFLKADQLTPSHEVWSSKVFEGKHTYLPGMNTMITILALHFHNIVKVVVESSKVKVWQIIASSFRTVPEAEFHAYPIL